MGDIKFRDLLPNEIDLRVGSTNDKGFQLLLYKDARVDMNILDETVGQFNWTKEFYQVKNTLMCKVGININFSTVNIGYENKEPLFIYKSDAGDESNTEAIKGEASDSFKRACFNWGIGRKLYTSPFVWITKDENNDPKKSHYLVKDIAYNEKEITKLVIINEKTKQVVYSYGNSSPKIQHEEKPQVDTQTVLKDRTELYSIVLKKYGEDVGTFNSWLSRKYGVGSLKELPDDKVGEVLAIMRKAKQ